MSNGTIHHEWFPRSIFNTLSDIIYLSCFYYSRLNIFAVTPCYPYNSTLPSMSSIFVVLLLIFNVAPPFFLSSQLAMSASVWQKLLSARAWAMVRLSLSEKILHELMSSKCWLLTWLWLYIWNIWLCDYWLLQSVTPYCIDTAYVNTLMPHATATTPLCYATSPATMRTSHCPPLMVRLVTSWPCDPAFRNFRIIKIAGDWWPDSVVLVT